MACIMYFPQHTNNMENLENFFSYFLGMTEVLKSRVLAIQGTGKLKHLK